jgi:hypothetical protein
MTASTLSLVAGKMIDSCTKSCGLVHRRSYCGHSKDISVCWSSAEGPWLPQHISLEGGVDVRSALSTSFSSSANNATTWSWS